MKTIHIAIIAAIFSSVSSAQNCNINQPDAQYEGQLVDLENGTILDVKTNLLWAKCTLGQIYDESSNSCSNDGATHIATWQEALQATEVSANTTIGAVTGFRLPNIKELTSIVNYQCIEPAINQTFFPATENEPYWSSTPDAPRSGEQINAALNGLVIDFTNGEEFIIGGTDRILIRLVKDYQ
ncbi:Lcl C-terminal domain-containing protein [Vibrio atypicus]|uniref:Lcl C-terminal domain-containing protein n=1 Tax=Vibrio atypicus TaxID=558271 RepID=UPI003735B8D5